MVVGKQKSPISTKKPVPGFLTNSTLSDSSSYMPSKVSKSVPIPATINQTALAIPLANSTLRVHGIPPPLGYTIDPDSVPQASKGKSTGARVEQKAGEEDLISTALDVVPLQLNESQIGGRT